MGLDQFIARVPKAVLVIVVLTMALIFIVVMNPLKDECDVKTDIFLKEMRGIITSVRVKKNKTQFAKLNFWKDRCRDGNTVGACEEYFTGLNKLTTALSVFPDKCQLKFIEENEAFPKYIYDAIQVMALVAWGERPPSGPSERLGWLTEAHLKTFCRLKKTFATLTSEEDLQSLRSKIYSQYPDSWPEAVDPEAKKPEDRPKALKSALNPTGTLDKDKVYERSLFSMRCDLYQ